MSHRPTCRVFLSGILALLTGALTSPLAAQTQRVAGFEPRAFALTGARLVAAPGDEIENGTLVIRDGVIAAVGQDIEIPGDADVIELKGHYVYTGFIDVGAADLLDDKQLPKPVAGRKTDFSRYALAATRPDNRHSLTPEFLAADGLKQDAEAFETLRKLGFTAVHVLPSGRVAAGQGSLLNTAAEPLREALLDESTLAVFQLFAPGGDRYPSTLMGATAHLRQAFLDAEHYRRHWELYQKGVEGIERPPLDPALEALQSVRAGEPPATFVATSRDDIHRALDFAAEHDLAIQLWGADEAYRCIERLKEAKVSLIVDLDFGDEPKIEKPSPDAKLTTDIKAPLRAQQDRLDRWNERVAGLAALHSAGIRFGVSSRGLKERGDLLKNLRKAIELGLDREAALAALTSDAADVLGVGNRLGTLARGKLAHVVVLTGPFDHEKSKVRHVFIEDLRFDYNEEAQLVEDGAAPGPTDKAPPASLAGRWQMTIESADGRVPAMLDLTQDGKRLGGSFTSEHGNGRVTQGRINDAQASFTVSIGAGDRAVELKFTAELDEGKLTGQLKPAFGQAAGWTAERVGSEPAVNSGAVELALDELVDEAPVEAPGPGAHVSQSMGELPTELRSDRLSRPVRTGGNVLVTGATVLTGTGQTLPETSILVRDGRIAEIGKDLEPDEGMTVIDARGRFVVPGIIDTHSHIMITAGINEATQSIVPEVRVRDVINTDDLGEYRALAGGVTAARLFHGSANTIGGQDAVVKLKHGATAREHLLPGAPQGVKFALGENVKFRTQRFPNTRMGVEATLNRAFLEAVDYRRRWMEYERARESEAPAEPPDAENGSAAASSSRAVLPPRRDLRLEALADIVDHKKFIHSHCYRADEILMLLRVASNLGIRVWSLQHVLEGYKVAPEIVAHGASCSTFSDWWAYKVEAYDAIPHNAALLNEAGANVVIKSDDRELIRHLYLEAAKAVRYGNMSPDDALQAITLNPARELGLDDRIGSIEIGKDADLAIFNGQPLNAFSRCEITLIEGEVYFSREDAPSAMTKAAAERSAAPPPLVIADSAIREKPLDLSVAGNGRYALVGATLYPVDAPPIPGGTLVVEDGRIAAIGTEIPLSGDVRVIDVSGLHITPGFIDAGTTVGLVEIGKVRETHDHAESGDLQPDLRAGVALNPDSELIPVARAGGITTMLMRPSGGLIAGQASVAKLAGWTAPEMIVELEAGLQIIWPSESRMEKETEILADFFEQARLYDRLRTQAEKENEPGPIADPRLEAMRPYLHAKKPVFIEADSHKQIAGALLFAEEQKLRIVVTGGTDAWKLAGELKQRNVPVIVGPVMRSPTAGHDPFDAPYANAARLWEAGVKFCIRSNHAANSRNAPFEAAMAAAFGLPVDEALRSVTLSSAEILGVADRAGSLTVGKQANLVIADGLPLQQTAQIKGVFIDGVPHRCESRQTRFYERYRQRLNGRPAPAELTR